MPDFNAQVIDEFRANDGVVGGMFEGMPMLLLHHVGAKSGETRIAPLAYMEHLGTYVIFASKAGAPENPGWYHNLKAHPETTVEVAGKTVKVLASEPERAERDRLFNAMAEGRPQFAEYQTKTDRVIPAIVLTPA